MSASSAANGKRQKCNKHIAKKNLSALLIKLSIYYSHTYRYSERRDGDDVCEKQQGGEKYFSSIIFSIFFHFMFFRFIAKIVRKLYNETLWIY
ncbi:hypothetical protein HMPREF0860_0421 [Treponema socranskii subsp. socranskii VPI DR56BR1116 = ATCC 35536]|uniref:Uncharacterized protein n=1 Tax=Treponema socranskii subsp. socranskii VPI DR56BR1116 = ATCC 35536 TaxID=1125725 RepID=U1GQU2_TRESO|nr:hypothetical protein HMPREF1325_2634 [Treponema socranskii subsp. socranskii VPI DR56BR1116 = ATCC 35536]ERJ97668.1 hypothetical protein HMPREF0860_0421 [Treponema socranskii subsp. socranskii VPI DR56BR1116 = ATCC 35536]